MLDNITPEVAAFALVRMHYDSGITKVISVEQVIDPDVYAPDTRIVYETTSTSEGTHTVRVSTYDLEDMIEIVDHLRVGIEAQTNT